MRTKGKGKGRAGKPAVSSMFSPVVEVRTDLDARAAVRAPGLLRRYVVGGDPPPDNSEGFAVQGVRLTLDDVIAREVDAFHGDELHEVGRHYETADERMAEMYDMAIWGPVPGRLAAVILYRPGGIRVIRLENPGTIAAD